MKQNNFLEVSSWLLPSLHQSEKIKRKEISLKNRAVFLKLINLFLAVLGLHCCVRVFSSCGKRGLLFVAVRGLLIVMASLAAEHRLSSCGAQA